METIHNGSTTKEQVLASNDRPIEKVTSAPLVISMDDKKNTAMAPSEDGGSKNNKQKVRLKNGFLRSPLNQCKRLTAMLRSLACVSSSGPTGCNGYYVPIQDQPAQGHGVAACTSTSLNPRLSR